MTRHAAGERLVRDPAHIRRSIVEQIDAELADLREHLLSHVVAPEAEVAAGLWGAEAVETAVRMAVREFADRRG